MTTPKCEMGCPLLIPSGEEYDESKTYKRLHSVDCPNLTESLPE